MSSGISDERLLDLYRVMVRIRAFENGVKQLMKEGRCSRVSLSTGGEAVAAGVSAHLTPHDQIGSTHRPLAHLVAKGADLKRMMAEIMAKATGTNRGKGGPYHIFDKGVGALGANGVVGGSVPMCAGYALADQLGGTRNVAVSYYGEGASNQGGVQETLNLAACWGLPVVFVCENSSPKVQRMLGHEIDYPQLSIDDVGSRGAAYGMPGSTHIGWDVEIVYEAAGEAVRRAREGGGPSLLEFKIYRLDGDTDDGYCPVRLFRERLTGRGLLTEGLDAEIWEAEAARVREAIDYAAGSPEPPLIDAYTGVYVEEDR